MSRDRVAVLLLSCLAVGGSAPELVRCLHQPWSDHRNLIVWALDDRTAESILAGVLRLIDQNKRYRLWIL